MRNMSFALTTEAIIGRKKTVTRRLGWLGLKPGDQVCPVRQCMGLQRGGRVEVLAAPLTVINVRREPLCAMIEDVAYGLEECRLEGFGDHPELRWPSAFVAMFCATHRRCTAQTVVTRIEFSYGTQRMDHSIP